MENLPFFDGIREEWEARGRLEMLFDLVETRFGNVPDELRSHLGALKGNEEIKQAMRKAITAETIEEYMAKLQH